jgi:(4S)-4-hydroxy-5-phosphonooxypentane-2,3-dione isomerase
MCGQINLQFFVICLLTCLPNQIRRNMIKRIVMMELLPGKEALFLDIFEKGKKEIRAMAGCEGLELLRREYEGHVSVWTISLWQSEKDLNAYRTSELFKKTWSAVKPLFSGKARAWTLTPIETIP